MKFIVRKRETRVHTFIIDAPALDIATELAEELDCGESDEDCFDSDEILDITEDKL